MLKYLPFDKSLNQFRYISVSGSNHLLINRFPIFSIYLSIHVFVYLLQTQELVLILLKRICVYKCIQSCKQNSQSKFCFALAIFLEAQILLAKPSTKSSHEKNFEAISRCTLQRRRVNYCGQATTLLQVQLKPI